jgi:enoyl-CoA hydratase/carnithine racemase
MTDGEVRYARDGEIATVIFDRPAARNAMTWRMYEQLGEACAQIRREDGLRAAVFRGAGGKAFIAGTDIAQFQAFRGDDGIAYEEKMEGILAGVETLPVPTLAVIEGFAIGGGLAIAAACDLRIVTPGSRLGVPIARTLGNCLSIANYARLIAALGASRAKRMLLLAENLSAPYRINLLKLLEGFQGPPWLSSGLSTSARGHREEKARDSMSWGLSDPAAGLAG